MFYLKIYFQQNTHGGDFPRVKIHELTSWDGKRGQYNIGESTWPCFDSYLNCVIRENKGYTYEMVLDSKEDKIVLENVLFALEEVRKYVKKEGQLPPLK